MRNANLKQNCCLPSLKVRPANVLFQMAHEETNAAKKSYLMELIIKLAEKKMGRREASDHDEQLKISGPEFMQWFETERTKPHARLASNKRLI